MRPSASSAGASRKSRRSARCSHDTGRRVTLHQLGGTEPQHGSFDRPKPLESPVGSEIGEPRIELAPSTHDFADQEIREAPLLRSDCQIIPYLGCYPIEILSAPHLARVERLERSGARPRLNPHRPD